MPSSSDVTRAPLVVLGNADAQCFESMQAFLAALPRLLAAAVPNNITNVIVSNIQPSSGQTGYVWFRLSNAGSFIGIYVFSQGAWQQIYPVNVDAAVDTTQIFWLQGDSTQPPPGFTNTDDAAIIRAAVKTHLKAMWLLESGVYTYYSAVFTSF